MNTQPISRKEFFLVIARTIARSQVARILFALVIAALGCGLAYLLWLARDAIAVALGAIVVLTGLGLAWEMLPFSEQTRSRWAREKELAKRFPSYRWRNALWVGLIMLADRIWDAYNRQKFDPWQFALPTAFLVVGLVSNAVWRIRHSDEQNACSFSP